MATVKIISPVAGERVRGTVEILVQVLGGSAVSDVSVLIGPPAQGTRQASSVGPEEFVFVWDTTRRLREEDQSPSGDAVFWVSARARVDGIDVVAPYLWVVTTNNADQPDGDQSDGSGWRPELEWAADYSGTLEQWRSSNFATIGAAYAFLEDDPALGADRRAIRVTVPDRARYDADQATPTTVRFQSSSPRVIVEGDEFCVGFAFYPPEDFPSVFPPNDPTNPGGPEGTSYIAIFQFYGPPYVQGAPFVLQANRDDPGDPVDEFVVRGNELNPGDPVDYLAVPYRRGRWTDVVFRLRVSTSVDLGWIETYINQGESTEVRPLNFVNGMHRIPRVLLRPDSEPFRTDMQVYRVVDRFAEVTLWHTGHRIARTVAEADPRSYRNGASSYAPAGTAR